MLFNSVHFLFFFPIVVGIYYLLPYKIRNYWLLVASYYFYMCWNAKYLLLLLFSTTVTFVSGLAVERIKQMDLEERLCRRYKKMCVATSFILNLSILFFFKYMNFGMESLNQILEKFHIVLNTPRFDFLLPVGISFYTFQALGYTVDVYRDQIYAEKNFFRYALFVSFFPQLVAGPIERSRNLLKQLAEQRKASFDNFRDGILLMLWGYFLKVVLADRIAIFVDTAYGDIETYTGTYLLIATMLFAIQIYCDFSGYSVIAMGTAKILGIDLMENFSSPYLSESVAEFWRRWHISLSGWFKDYLYIPLGGNRKGKKRKYINLLITFGVSGLWHGANWTYVVWGFLNGIFQIIGDLLLPLKRRAVVLLDIKTNSLSHKMMKTVATFLLVDFTWIFFRASSIRESLRIIKRIVTVQNPWILLDGSLYTCGLDQKNFQLMIWGIILLMTADVCKYKGIKLRKVIAEQDYWAQCFLVVVFSIGILLFGIWGIGYDAANFIYFQF
ncbi:MAG: MBOAT family protein [Lachnospiraceae bacterium]|nr:MBOAT family protein [Lachnospiraceae bacterium]